MTEENLSVTEQEKALQKEFPTLTGFVYYSDPDNAEKMWHHKVIPTFNHEEKGLLPYMLHAKRPSDDLQDGIWSISNQDWIENSKEGQGELIASQNKQINSLLDANKSLTADNQTKKEQIAQLQESISQSGKTTAQLAHQFNSFGTQMTQTLSKVTNAVNKLTETKSVEVKEGEK